MSPNAEPEVIQAAYRALMRKHHPDANGGASSDARAKRITEAYSTLSDPRTRAAYDAQLRAADSPPPQPEPARRDASPAEPADGFAPTKPVRQAPRKMGPLTWVLATLATAIAGLAAGHFSTSPPAHENQAVAEPAAKPLTSTGERQPPDQASAEKESSGRTAGSAAATRAVAAIVSDDIVPRWRPDCSAAAGPVVVDVQVNLAPDGSLLSARTAGAAGAPSQLAAARESAERAVRQAAPFALPAKSYGQWRMFIVRFDTKDVCGLPRPGALAPRSAQPLAALPEHAETEPR